MYLKSNGNRWVPIIFYWWDENLLRDLYTVLFHNNGLSLLSMFMPVWSIIFFLTRISEVHNVPSGYTIQFKKNVRFIQYIQVHIKTIYPQMQSIFMMPFDFVVVYSMHLIRNISHKSCIKNRIQSQTNCSFKLQFHIVFNITFICWLRSCDKCFIVSFIMCLFTFWTVFFYK